MLRALTTHQKNSPCPAGKWDVASRIALLPAFFLLFFLFGCASVPGDPYSTDEHWQQAEGRIAVRDLPGAISELELAIRKAPHDPELYLRQGELLEATGEIERARRTYLEARTVDVPPQPKRELSYRLSLLEALKFHQLQEAEKLLADLPAGSVEHYDLRGVLALLADEPRQALLYFNQALKQGPARDKAANILYHASLAYRKLGDVNNAYTNLYKAVNLAENEGLLKDIERLFTQLNASTADH